MKKIFLAIASVAVIVIVGCSGKNESSEAVLAQAERSGEAVLAKAVESNASGGGNANLATGEEAVRTVSKNWLSGDFKVVFDFNPTIEVSAMPGAEGMSVTGRRTVVKKDNSVFVHTVPTGTEGEVIEIYREENGEFTYYRFDPSTKAVIDMRSGFRTLENWAAMVLEGIYETPGQINDFTKTGTERIAGIMCDVYSNRGSQSLQESKAEISSEADGWAALIGALGGDSSDLREMQGQIASMDAHATYWIDPSRGSLILRKYIYTSILGRVTEGDVFRVVSFQEGNIAASEIPNLIN